MSETKTLRAAATTLSTKVLVVKVTGACRCHFEDVFARLLRVCEERIRLNEMKLNLRLNLSTAK